MTPSGCSQALAAPSVGKHDGLSARNIENREVHPSLKKPARPRGHVLLLSVWRQSLCSGGLGLALTHMAQQSRDQIYWCSTHEGVSQA